MRISLFIALCCIAAPPAMGDDTLVRSVDAFHRAVEEAQPGDTILLANGVWRDAHLDFDADGMEGDTITVRAETPGQVVLTGTSRLRIGGSYLKVEGLWFHRGALEGGHVIAFRINQNRPAHHSRLTNCAITEYNPPNWLTGYKWVSIYGTHNRVDHNYFAGKTHDGTTLVVWLEDPPNHEPNYHRIDHNHFGYRPPLGKNGGETIRIGTSHRSMQDSRTVVEYNLFERTDGEHEIISNKSGENIFRHNTFLESQGALTLRHGNRAVVANNFFLGNGRPGTGGVRVIGEDHLVQHNYFAGLQGDSSRAALPIMNGIPDSPLNRYFQVKNAHIANNTFVDTRITILYGLGMDSEKSLPPQGVSFVDNVVYTDSPAPVVFAMAPSQDITWSGNVFYGSDPGIPLPQGIRWENPKFLLGKDGLWRPDPKGPAAGKGAMPEGRPLTPDDVGPAWFSLPWTPRILSENDNSLPDFSYAGYHWGERPPPDLPPTIDVTDFGATGDDMNDDSNAFKRALSAAQSMEGPVVLHIPAGRYHISDILFIERSDFVLQGAGSGENGTVIAIEKALGAMDMPPALQKMRQSLIEKDKRVNGLPPSPFSRMGGVFWTRLPDLSQPEMLTPITGGMRGAYRMEVADATGLETGQMVRVTWFTPNGAGLPPCTYEAPKQKPDNHPEENPCSPPITQDVTITGIVDNTILIKEPLLHGLSPGWRAQLMTTAFLSEVGIEHLRIEFADVPYAGHHLEDGYNAFYLTGLRNGWIRNVHIHNADAGILTNSSSNLTLQNLTFTGRTSHYNIHMGDVHHVLAKDFEAKNPSLHPVGFGAGSRASVFTRGRILQPGLDQHRGFQHQNLFDDLTLVEDRNHSTLFTYSGISSPEAAHGAHNTFWNIRISFEHPETIRLPGYLGAVEKGRGVRIIGLKANVPIRFEYGPDTYTEGVNRTGIEVPSLYRYQLHRRLGDVTTSQQ